MKEDPDAVAEYFAANCIDEVLRGPETTAIFAYLNAQAQHGYVAGPLYEMRQCVDTFGAIDKFARCASVAGIGLTSQHRRPRLCKCAVCFIDPRHGSHEALQPL